MRNQYIEWRAMLGSTLQYPRNPNKWNIYDYTSQYKQYLRNPRLRQCNMLGVFWFKSNLTPIISPPSKIANPNAIP